MENSKDKHQPDSTQDNTEPGYESDDLIIQDSSNSQSAVAVNFIVLSISTIVASPLAAMIIGIANGAVDTPASLIMVVIWPAVLVAHTVLLPVAVLFLPLSVAFGWRYASKAGSVMRRRLAYALMALTFAVAAMSAAWYFWLL